MSKVSLIQLDKAKKLLETGKLDEALQIIRILEKEERISLVNQLECKLIRSRIDINKGDFLSTLKLSEEVLNGCKNFKKPLLELDACISKGEALRLLGKFDESLKTLNKGLDKINNIKDIEDTETKERNAILLHDKGLTLNRLGLLDQALEVLSKSIEIFEELGDKDKIAPILTSLSIIHINKGNLERALIYSKQSLAILEELDSKRNIASALTTLGIICDLKGDSDDAFSYFLKSLEIFKDLGNKQDISASLINIGSFTFKKGDLSKALDYFKKSLEIYEEIGNKQEIAASLNNIAQVYLQMGLWDRAFAYNQRSLAFRKEIGNKQEIAGSLHNLGHLSWLKGDINSALCYFEESFRLKEEIGNNINTANTLFTLIAVNIDNGSIDKANEYFKRLLKINNLESNLPVDQRTRLSEALLLKSTQQIEELVKAEETLTEILKEKASEKELEIIIYLNLCEILLSKEMRKDIQRLEKSSSCISILFEIAKGQRSDWLLAGTYILQAKVSFIELQTARSFENNVKVKEFILKAQSLARNKEYYVIEVKTYLLLIQLNILLGVFFLDQSYFKKAEVNFQKAEKLAEEQNLLQESVEIEKAGKRILSYKESYLKTMDMINEEKNQNVQIKKIEEDFLYSIDNYLMIVKNIFSQFG